MKGFNHIMTQLVSLLSSSDSLWAILQPLALLVVLLVILPICLVTFVKSLTQGKKLNKTSQVFLATFEESLKILILNLKKQSETELPKDLSQSLTLETPVETPVESQPEPELEPELTAQALLENRLEKIINFIKEVSSNEKY